LKCRNAASGFREAGFGVVAEGHDNASIIGAEDRAAGDSSAERAIPLKR